MSQPIQPGLFLRRVLWADALVSAAVGAVMALGASPLHGQLGMPGSVLALAGVALFPYAAYVAWLATRRRVPRAAIWVAIVVNLVWAIDCGLLMVGTAMPLTPLGEGFLVLQVVTVLAFAALEFIGLKRGCAIVPA
ncbi:hypothetical protein [Rhizobacter sp. Root404]|uniref:hypothetical protein n=1 Tax=Rhizobacter sp. Root404 TaxID=1736528 RepID=UPI0009EC86BC|nr:hypothetical protein [Rhizobacter sp. Root404]